MQRHETNSRTKPETKPVYASRTAERRKPVRDATRYLKAYVHERPDVVALWSLGFGIILGWKIKRRW